ncbi:MAG: LPXTG cell wall anchor domain-containing protein [Clostridia bacterium]|nr:LPXTG cell wall anchor domain-containing protein [Clostridia bacterium]
MKTLKKLTAIVATLLVAATIFATKSHAFSKADLQEYMTTQKDFTGTELIIRSKDKAKLESFFKKTEITDEQAEKIKGYIDEAVKYMNEDGAKSPNKVSTKEKKQRLLQFAKDAAAVLNLTVSYDASEERLDIYDANGKFIDSLYWGVEVKNGKGTTEPALVQTGSTNYVYIAVAGVVLVAGATLIVARKNALSVNA